MKGGFRSSILATVSRTACGEARVDVGLVVRRPRGVRVRDSNNCQVNDRWTGHLEALLPQVPSEGTTREVPALQGTLLLSRVLKPITWRTDTQTHT